MSLLRLTKGLLHQGKRTVQAKETVIKYEFSRGSTEKKCIGLKKKRLQQSKFFFLEYCFN